MPVPARGPCAVGLGLGVGWGAGNVGPVAISLTHSFGVSLGSALEDAGVSWRVGFVISAAVCTLPLLVLPPRLATRPVPRPGRAFVAAVLRTGMLWRHRARPSPIVRPRRRERVGGRPGDLLSRDGGLFDGVAFERWPGREILAAYGGNRTCEPAVQSARTFGEPMTWGA